MATGKAPISGGFAIFCGLFFVTTVVLAITWGITWLTVLSSLSVFILAVMNWRGFQRSNREYEERLERLEQQPERDD